eukprot:s2239_g12.t1
MLGCGLKEVLMTKGFIATVHEVSDDGASLRLPNGEFRILQFDLNHVPTTKATSKLQRWRKLLNRCQRSSATIRFLGTKWVSGNRWTADESTILLEQAVYLQECDLKLWEWFSGAFGGWSRAAEFLHDKGFPISVVGASDIDHQVTEIWNSNRMLTNKTSSVVAQVMDVKEIENWESVVEAGSNCVSISSSCKSFSLAGLQKGWQSEDGQTLAIALFFAARHGFRCIVLENVSNLRHDPKLYQQLKDILSFCGLEIAYEGVISMRCVHPAERTRLIMVIAQKDDPAMQHGFECKFVDHVQQKTGNSLWESKRWMTLPEELIDDLLLDEQTLDQYAKHTSMPQAMRQKMQVWNRVSALYARTITSKMAMPAGTMMAGYNHQHIIAESTGSKQILGSLRHVKDLTFRFVHPIEVVVALGTVFGVVLPRNIRLSMSGVGNCISEMHALIGLAAGFKVWKGLFPQVFDFEVHDLVRVHRDECLGVGSFEVVYTEEKVCVTPIGENPLSSSDLSHEAQSCQTQKVCSDDAEVPPHIRACQEPLTPGIRASEKHPDRSTRASAEHSVEHTRAPDEHSDRSIQAPDEHPKNIRASVEHPKQSICTSEQTPPSTCVAEDTHVPCQITQDDEVTTQKYESPLWGNGEFDDGEVSPIEHENKGQTQTMNNLHQHAIPTQAYADVSMNDDMTLQSENAKVHEAGVPSTIQDSQEAQASEDRMTVIDVDSGDEYHCCRILTVGESMIDPPFECKFHKTTQVSEIIQAENHLNVDSLVVGVFGDNDVPIIENMSVQDSSIIVSRVPNVPREAFPGMFVCFDGGAIHLNLQPINRLDEWTIESQSLDFIDWAQENGVAFYSGDMVRSTKFVTTAHDFGWPQTKKKGEVYLVRVQDNAVQGTWIKHTYHETVGDLLHAEQVLIGPSDKVVHAHDRFANEVDHMTKLTNMTILVIHILPNDQNIAIQIQWPNERKTFQVTRGTRLCAILHCQMNECIVDQHGFEVSRDMPAFASGLFKIQPMHMHEEDPLTPTQPFSVVADEPQDLHPSSPDVHRLVQRTTHNIRDSLNCICHTHPEPDPLSATKRRLDLLCLMGPAVGDDEMAYHVSAIQQSSQEPVAHVVWDSLGECWERDHASAGTDLFNDSPRKTLVCWIHAHWVPVVIENCHDNLVIEYLNSAALTDSQIRSLQEMCNCRAAQPHWIFQESVSGWCGFEALAWICAKLQIALAPMHSYEKQDILRDMSEVVEPENFQSYCQRTDDFSGQMSICLNMRLRFIRNMFVRPTSATMHGFGPDEAKSNLKLAGKLAAILIGHGHEDQESIRVSHELADKHAAQARSIPTMKDARAYATILELTVQHGIQITTLTKTQAVAKLQKFFRMKHEKKQQANKPPRELDLAQVEFMPLTWMVQNGEYVMPNQTWTVGSKGLSLASIDEVQPYLDQGRLLTTDSNSVLLSKPAEVQDPFKIEAHEVPVKDQVGNRAIIRIWILHLGQKPVVRAPKTNGEVQLHDMITLVVSAVQDQLDPVTWKSIVDAPARNIIQLLIPGKKNMEIHQVWSRRWTAKGKLVDAKIADSFSMLIRVQKQAIDDWLTLSGVGAQPVYVSPKTVSKEDQPSEEQYRVIWLGKQKSDALACIGTIADHKGIVFKWPSSFGLRVGNKRFPTAWKELKDNEDVPSQVRCVFKYVCDGIPGGMTGTQFETWASAVQWPVRVLKRFADGRFLVGSEKELPSEHLAINDKPIVCQPFVARNHGRSDQVVVGKLRMSMQQPTDDPRGEDTVFQNDPWKASHPAQRNMAASQSLQSPWVNYKQTKPSGQGSKTTHDEHTMDMFAKQSTRIAEVETELQNIKSQLTLQQSATEQKFAQVEETIQTVNSSLCSSLQKALQDQSASLVSTFEALLRQHPREQQRSRSPTRAK